MLPYGRAHTIPWCASVNNLPMQKVIYYLPVITAILAILVTATLLLLHYTGSDPGMLLVFYMPMATVAALAAVSALVLRRLLRLPPNFAHLAHRLMYGVLITAVVCLLIGQFS